MALPARLESQLRDARCCSALLAFAHATDAELATADVMVLDPMLVPECEHAVLMTRVESATLPCVLYTIPSPVSLRAVAALQRLDPVRVLVADVDDGPAAIRSAVADAVRRGDAASLRRALEARVRSLPPPLQFAIELLLRRPEQFFDAADLARHAGLSRRHLDRVLEREGLAPAKQWVIAARVWHAVHLQHRRRMPLSQVAERLGYADPKALRRHRAAVLGATDMEAPDAERRGRALGEVVGYLTTRE